MSMFDDFAPAPQQTPATPATQAAPVAPQVDWTPTVIDGIGVLAKHSSQYDEPLYYRYLAVVDASTGKRRLVHVDEQGEVQTREGVPATLAALMAIPAKEWTNGRTIRLKDGSEHYVDRISNVVFAVQHKAVGLDCSSSDAILDYLNTSSQRRMARRQSYAERLQRRMQG